MKWISGAEVGTVLVSTNSYYSNGLHVDSSENVYVLDSQSHKLRKFKTGETSTGTIIAGTGTAGSGNDQLNNPSDFHVDANGNIYIADVFNNRIQKIQLAPQITIPAGSTTGTLTIIGVEDDAFTDEEDETIIVTPLSSTYGTLSSSDATTLTLLNNSIILTRKTDPFLGLSKGAVSWGDYDNDGDKDVVIMGQSNTAGAVTKLYKNDNGSFVDTNTSLKKLYDGDLTWVDLNKDGNIDIVASGFNGTPQTRIYLNKVTNFILINDTYGLPELFSSKMAWGDLDNDGDIDLAFSGIDKDNNYLFDIYYREDARNHF